MSRPHSSSRLEWSTKDTERLFWYVTDNGGLGVARLERLARKMRRTVGALKRQWQKERLSKFEYLSNREDQVQLIKSMAYNLVTHPTDDYTPWGLMTRGRATPLQEKVMWTQWKRKFGPECQKTWREDSHRCLVERLMKEFDIPPTEEDFPQGIWKFDMRGPFEQLQKEKQRKKEEERKRREEELLEELREIDLEYGLEPGWDWESYIGLATPPSPSSSASSSVSSSSSVSCSSSSSSSSSFSTSSASSSSPEVSTSSSSSSSSSSRESRTVSGDHESRGSSPPSREQL